MSQPGILDVDDEYLVLNNPKIPLKNQFNNKYIYQLAESADAALEILDKLKNNNTAPSGLAKL